MSLLSTTGHLMCRHVGLCSLLRKISRKVSFEEASGKTYTHPTHLHSRRPIPAWAGGRGSRRAQCMFALKDFEKGYPQQVNATDQEDAMNDERTTARPRFLKVTEAAELLRLAPKSLYSLVSQRRIKYRKAGRRLLFLESELIEWTQPAERKRRL